MRVLQLTDDFSHTGGIRSAIRNTTELLRQHGHDVAVFSPDEDRGAALSRWLSLRHLRRLRRELARQPVDILHAHSVSMRLSPLPLLAAVERGTPVVMTVHDFNYVCPRKWMIDPSGRPCPRGLGAACLVLDCYSGKRGYRYLPYHGLRLLKILLHRSLLRRFVSVFIAPSETLAYWLRRGLGIAPRDIVQVANFVPPMGPGTGGAERSGLLFSGRLSPEKGVDLLLEAFSALHQDFPQVRLVIAGDGPARRSLERLSQRLGVEPWTEFTGMLDPELLARRYATARCVVFPSLWLENCPMGVLEAMSAGATIVASRVGGIPEIVDDDRTGLLFERGDGEQLGLRLRRVLTEPTLADRLGGAARAEAERRFSPRAHWTQLTEVYRRCLTPAVARSLCG